MDAHLEARRRRLLYAGAAFVAISSLAGLLAVVMLSRDSRSSGEASPQESSNFLQLLALIPDGPEARFDLMLLDYERLFSVTQRPRGATVDPGDEVASFLNDSAERIQQADLFTITGGGAAPGLLAPLSAYSMVVLGRANLGFSPYDTAGYALAGRHPGFYEAIVGRFDADVVREKISSCPACGVEPEHIRHAGRDYFAWGEELRNRLRIRLEPPAFDELGRGSRLAASPDFVLRTLTSKSMEEMLDAVGGNRPSLAQNEDFVLVVGALDSQGAISAYVTDCTLSTARINAWLETLTPALRDEESGFWAAHYNQPILKPCQVYAIASGYDGEPFTIVVMLHASRELAEANVERLRHRLASYHSPLMDGVIGDLYSAIEIKADGRLLIARLSGHADPNRILVGSPVLLHE